MKKLSMVCLLVIGMIATSKISKAQNFEEGQIGINAGIGIGGGFGIPIGLSGEYGISDKLGVGGFLGFAGKSEDLGFYKVKYSYFLVGARANYHFDLDIDNLDPYAGVILGYNAASVKLDGAPAGTPSPTAGGAVFGAHAGARYFFTESIGAYAEVGYGLGIINLGVTAKF